MTTPTRVLFVCLGNICRSPAAEAVFLHQIREAGLEERFIVDSAGTGSWHVGKRADPRMRAAAARRGLELTSRARQLDAADLRHFDHILTMDAANLSAVQSLAQRSPASGEGAEAVVEPLVRYCRLSRAEAVPDPYYGGDQGFEEVLDLLEDACDGLLKALMQS
jgi:protein-tyrosine phosphatase